MKRSSKFMQLGLGLFLSLFASAQEPTSSLQTEFKPCGMEASDVLKNIDQREKYALSNSQNKHAVPILPIAPCASCNDPVCRDGYDLSINNDWIEMHLRLYLFRNDDRDEQQTHLALEQLVAKTNADFAQAFIRFSYDVVYVDDNERRLHNTPHGLTFDYDVINVLLRGINESHSNYWNIGGMAGNPILLNDFVLNDPTSYALTHELGHNFGLIHVFGHGALLSPGVQGPCGVNTDYPGAPDQNLRGDYCSDTRPTRELGSNIPACSAIIPGNTCGSLGFQSWAYYQTNGLADDMLDNYMQYGSPSSCKNTFTPQQIARMRCYINSFHHLQHQTDWVTNNGFFNFPFADMDASEEHALVNQNIQFTSRASSNTVSYLWKFGNGATSTLANPVYAYPNPGYYKVKLEVTNATGQTWSQEIVDYIKVNAVGYNMPYAEDFESTLIHPVKDWYVVNQDPSGLNTNLDRFTWTGVYEKDDFRPYISTFYPSGSSPSGYIQPVVGADGNLTTAMFVNNQGNNNPNTHLDNLISPDINLIPGAAGCFLDPVLEFEISYVPVAVSGASNCNMSYAVPPGTPVSNIPNYAPGFAPEKQLVVLSSINGGLNWNQIYNQAGSNLHTVPGTCSAFAFTPSDASQWRTEQISIAPLVGNANVRFNFELSSDPYANALYLDNVRVRDAMAPDLGRDLVVCRNTIVDLGVGMTPQAGYTYAWHKLNNAGVPGPVLSTTVPFSVNANWPTTIVGRNYRLCVTRTSTGCTVCDDIKLNTMTCFIDGEAGLDDKELFARFDVAPNPGSGVFELLINEDLEAEMTGVEIVNTLGEVMIQALPKQMKKQDGIYTLDLSAKPKGVYFVRLLTKEGFEVRKVILQ